MGDSLSLSWNSFQLVNSPLALYKCKIPNGYNHSYDTGGIKDFAATTQGGETCQRNDACDDDPLIYIYPDSGELDLEWGEPVQTGEAFLLCIEGFGSGSSAGIELVASYSEIFSVFWAPSPLPAPIPTSLPSPLPSLAPTPLPTDVFAPTPLPSLDPTDYPTTGPSNLPTSSPSLFPSPLPTYLPSPYPSTIPSGAPTSLPSLIPTSKPTIDPTSAATTGVEIGLTLTSNEAYPTDDVLETLLSFVAEAAGVDTENIKNIVITSEEVTRRQRRRLSTAAFLWVFSCSVNKDLSAQSDFNSGIASSLDWEDSIVTSLNNETLRDEMMAKLPSGLELSVETIAVIAMTRNPSFTPTSLPSVLPTSLPSSKEDSPDSLWLTKLSAASTNVLFLGIAVAFLLVGVMLLSFLMVRKRRQNISQKTDTFKNSDAAEENDLESIGVKRITNDLRQILENLQLQRYNPLLTESLGVQSLEDLIEITLEDMQKVGIPLQKALLLRRTANEYSRSRRNEKKGTSISKGNQAGAERLFQKMNAKEQRLKSQQSIQEQDQSKLRRRIQTRRQRAEEAAVAAASAAARSLSFTSSPNSPDGADLHTEMHGSFIDGGDNLKFNTTTRIDSPQGLQNLHRQRFAQDERIEIKRSVNDVNHKKSFLFRAGIRSRISVLVKKFEEEGIFTDEGK